MSNFIPASALYDVESLSVTVAYQTLSAVEGPETVRAEAGDYE